MVRFNPKARLDTSRMREVGGGGGGRGGGIGGGGIGVPHIAGGGGVVGVIVVVVYVLIQVLGSSGGGSQLTSARLATQGGYSADYSQCRTGADANSSNPRVQIPCSLVAYENSLYDYWSKQPDLARRLRAEGTSFSPEKAVVTFEGQVQTGGCGSATTDVGPFYCSGDGDIYLDEAFYSTVARQLGIDPTGFVRAYVVAHEYGHHIQDLLGTMSKVHTRQGPDSDSVRLELQADCYAGMWANAASDTKDSSGVDIFDSITRGDVQQAVTAAGEVGDDYIQKRMSGSVDQGSFTHGTSQQRMAWFSTGYGDTSGDLGRCDTFGARNLSDPASVG
ncbi:MAG: neutral zinc metallopeptidase [Nocardioidaceae bacterium]|nr:neutral zinc metallopeptidase [Nocardioidaceae bacterium]